MASVAFSLIDWIDWFLTVQYVLNFHYFLIKVALIAVARLMLYSWWWYQKRRFCSILVCNTAKLERRILYKTRTVEMVHYQDETNCHVLESKQRPLPCKGHWTVSCCAPMHTQLELPHTCICGLWKSLQNLHWRLLHRCKECSNSEKSFKC